MRSKLPNNHRAMINHGEENEMEIFGYRISFAWIVLCVIGYLVSGGVLLLLFYWKPEWSVWANCVPSSLEKANVILLRTTDERKKYTRKKVRWFTLAQYKDSLNAAKCSALADENSIVNRAIRRPDLKVKYIRVQKIRYVWDNYKKEYQKIGTLEEDHSCYSIHSKYASGLGQEEQDIRRIVCGHNTIEVEVAPLWKLFINKVLNLFYIYQFFTVVLWLAEGYLGYAIAILLLAFCTITLSLMELRQQSSKLHNLVKAHNNMKVTVCRKGEEYSQIESRYLVPGDIIILSGKNFFMSCDAILINGTCIINEGMLTGECIPVTKTQLPHADDTMPWMQHSGEDYKRHILFCGTDVIRTESTVHGPAKAVVLRTGFNTTKGDMVRSILYPKPLNFKLHRDVKWFFGFLGFLAVVGIVYAIIIFVQRGVSAGRIVVECLVLLTSAICPIIPAALTVGILYAQSRLKKKSIFCISPARINMCGQLNLFCFDKTGTLTEDGLDLMGIIPSGGTCFKTMLKHDQMHELSWGPMFAAMTSCHSLIMVDGNLQGDPLDLKMFEATKWVLEDTGKCDEEGSSTQNMVVRPQSDSYNNKVAGINVLFQYPFSSSMQRMSVITEVIGGDGELTVFMKGAPEMVASFCKPETVPKEFSDELEVYTFQGLRVIGVASKILRNANKDDLESTDRDEVESDLEFLGLLILENRLKPETKAVLEELNAANIRPVMITGDNIQTATTVAKNCSMIPDGCKVILVEADKPEGGAPASVTWKVLEYPQTAQDAKTLQDVNLDIENIMDAKKQNNNYNFSMSGKTYDILEKHFPDLLPKILMNGTVFARMSPGQKSTIIDEFRKLDYYVGMCGDGANDCAALKMANAGISLSVQEASVAAPFNSLVTNIKCVPELLKEGRAALVTSFCMFKYMSMFGLIEYINTLLLYWQRNIFGNNQFLVHDFAVMFVIFLTMSSTPGYHKLAPYRPPGQLVSPSMLLSVVFHVCFSMALLTYAFLIVQQQPWYSRDDVLSACYPANGSINQNLTYELIHNRSKKNYESFENTTLWLITAVYFVILALCLSKGKPFRQPLYTNYIFVATLIVEFALTLFFIFANFKNMYFVLELVCTPTSWRIHMLVMLVICLVVSYSVEEFILDNRALWQAVKRCLKLKPGSNYKKLRAVLEEDSQWPPVGEIVYEKSTVANGDASKYTNPAYEHDEVITNGINGIHINH